MTNVEAFSRGLCLAISLIVATVAFGMGFDRAMYAVIHYHLPKSIENYVQEIAAQERRQESILPPHADDEDFILNHSLCHSDGIDAPQPIHAQEHFKNESSTGITVHGNMIRLT